MLAQSGNYYAPIKVKPAGDAGKQGMGDISPECVERNLIDLLKNQFI